MSPFFSSETFHIFLRTLLCHRLIRLALSQLLGLLVVFLQTLALSLFNERLALSEPLLSPLAELDGLCADLALFMLVETCSIRNFTSFLKQDETELAFPPSLLGFLFILP